MFRFLFLPLALLYVGLVLFWGHHDLARVHLEYRVVTKQLTGSYARERAGREVEAGCRQATGGEKAVGYGDCLRSSARLVEIRAAVISAGLIRERQQALKKLLLFYGLVGGLLIGLPLALLYISLAFLRYLLDNIRFRKG